MGQPGGGGPQSPYGPGWAVRKAREVLGLERRNGWGEAQVTVILLLKRTMKNALQTWQNITCDATKKVSTSAPNIPVWGYRHPATQDRGKMVNECNKDIQDRSLEPQAVLLDLCLDHYSPIHSFSPRKCYFLHPRKQIILKNLGQINKKNKIIIFPPLFIIYN